MSKTYDLPATLYTGRTGNTSDGGWDVYDSTHITQSEYVGYAGKLDTWYYATNMMFDSATLNTLRAKTITGVTVELNVTQAMTAAGLIAWKLNSTASGNSNSRAWARGNNAGTATAGDSSVATTDNPSIAPQSLSVGTRTFTLKELPQYGLVAGPYSSNTNGRWRFSSAILHVTTNETDYSYTLAFNANSGSGAPSSITGSNTQISPSYTFTIPNTIPTRSGYTFLGWSKSSTATSASYAPGGQITVAESGTTTLYAVWSVNTYTVGYNANGGTGAPASQTKTHGVNLTLSSTKPTRAGYSFVSWNTKADGTGTSYASGGTYTANVSATLYAIWADNSRTVSYNANGGTGAPASQSFISGSSVKLSSATPTRTGHLFLGWSQSQSASTASYAAGGTYTFNANVTLYAVWTPQTYSISFNANGGTGAPAAQTKTYGVNLTLTSSQPARAGYTFLGWARSNVASVADYAPGATYSENGNATLYAVWSVVVSTHTLTYNANGGTGAPAAQTQTYSVEDQRSFTVTNAQPTRDGYAFLGWSNTDAGTVDYVSGDTITAAADKTIYAVWEKVQFTISYDANGGVDAPAAQTKQKDVAITITDGVPANQGFVFFGWSTDAQATEAEYHGGDLFTTDADTVLYAVWSSYSSVNVYVIRDGEPVECDVYTVVSGEPVLCDILLGGS